MELNELNEFTKVDLSNYIFLNKEAVVEYILCLKSIVNPEAFGVTAEVAKEQLTRSTNRFIKNYDKAECNVIRSLTIYSLIQDWTLKHLLNAICFVLGATFDYE